MATKKLNFREYWDHVGSDVMFTVLEGAGVKLPYARTCRIGLKTFGRESALRIIESARAMTPGWEPDLELLLRGVEPSGKGALKIKPSPEFLKTQRKKA